MASVNIKTPDVAVSLVLLLLYTQNGPYCLTKSNIFKFLWWVPKDAFFLQLNAYQPFEVIQGQLFWYQSKEHNMLLPITRFSPL